MLRRSLDDLSEAAQHELRPFYELPSLFERGNSVSRVREVLKGNIADLQIADGAAVLHIQTGGAARAWEIRNVRSTLMTVWRVNNELDALQVRFHTDNDDVYLQTGGQHLLALFQELNPQTNLDLEIDNALHLFLEQTLHQFANP